MHALEQPIRLGVFDINGTLCDTTGIPESIPQGFTNIHRQGIQTTIITGRSTATVENLLGIHRASIVTPGLPISVENGGRLVAADGQNLRYHRIGASVISAIMDGLSEASDGIRYIAYTPKEPGSPSVLWLPENQTPEEYILANGNHVKVENASLQQMARYLVHEQACMIRVGCSSPAMLELFDYPDSNIFANGDELNILAASVDKATGIMDLAEYLNIPFDQILVAGNDFNDAPMFNLSVAHKIGVGNLIEAPVQVTSPDVLGNYLMGYVQPQILQESA